MKRFFIFFFSILSASSLAFAQSTEKTVVLKDGSVIKGNVVKMENGVYTVSSEHLGQIEIKDTDIAGIQSSNAPIIIDNNNTAAANASQTGDIKNQVNALQSSIISDPEMMKDIAKLLDDPAILSLLSDQSFVNDVMSMDKSKLENNPKINQMMSNPKVKELIEKIQARHPNVTNP
jgi:hypothetical protein